MKENARWLFVLASEPRKAATGTETPHLTHAIADHDSALIRSRPLFALRTVRDWYDFPTGSQVRLVAFRLVKNRRGRGPVGRYVRLRISA